MDPKKRQKKISNALLEDKIGIDLNRDGEAISTVNAPHDGPDPVCGLSTEPNSGGNVLYVDGDIQLTWKDKPQSASCHGRGNVWLYAQEYGDVGAALIEGHVNDLKDEPYGYNKRSFSQIVRAL